MSARRTRRVGRFGIAAQLGAGLVWVLAGCSLVVSGDPTIVCKSDVGCAADQRCATALGTCVATSSACTDDTCNDDEHCDTGTLRCVSNDDPTPVDDGGADATEPQRDADSKGDADATTPVVHIGDSCAAQADCAHIIAKDSTRLVAGTCALQSLIGFTTDTFCTTHCCTTDDCPTDYFCEHGPNAGRYCVPFGKDTRTAPTGSKAPGATCTTNAECTTGSCDYADPNEQGTKTCIDTCCSDADCGTGLVCGLRDVNESLEWICRTPIGSKGPKADCSISGAASCKTGACYGDSDAFCTAPCCNNGSCTSLGLNRCVSGSTAQGTSRVNICTTDDGTTKNPGAACTSDAECASNICASLHCAATCCTDAECSSGSACVADGIEPRPHCSAN